MQAANIRFLIKETPSEILKKLKIIVRQGIKIIPPLALLQEPMLDYN